MRIFRLPRVIAATLVATAAAVALTASPASATINTTTAPYKDWTWGDCTMRVGYHVRPDHLATAGTTVTCRSRHNTQAILRLKRNGSVVAAQPSGLWSNAFGFGSTEVFTPTYTTPGGANWQVQMDITISGLGTASVTSGSPVYWVNGT